jgi:hypothetical protein
MVTPVYVCMMLRQGLFLSRTMFLYLVYGLGLLGHSSFLQVEDKIVTDCGRFIAFRYAVLNAVQA